MFYFRFGAAIWACALATPCVAMTQADAAKEIATELPIATTDSRETLYGLWPAIFPGGYEGTGDIAYPEREATLENVIVALVRWTGWDTVSYDRSHLSEIKTYASPEGFPYYKPSPSPRSIPYIAAALHAGLIDPGHLPQLRLPVTAEDVRALTSMALHLRNQPSPATAIGPTLALSSLSYPTNDARFALLSPGFGGYSKLNSLPGSVLDLNGPEIRLFTPGSSLADGKQKYFPLGPLETTLSVGQKVKPDNLSHQSEAIYGLVENESRTNNAVGVWGAAVSQAKDARVWGGFLVGETSRSPEQDAQVVGLEVDVLNYALPGSAPNASKSGIQIVGIGSQPVSDAIHIIGAEQAQWNNGIVFAPDAVVPSGAFIGATGTRPVSRGIDFANVRFTDAALALGQWSGITFRNATGGTSAILTDDKSQLVIRAGERGFRIVDVTSNKRLLEVTSDGDIVTPYGKLSEIAGVRNAGAAARWQTAMIAALSAASIALGVFALSLRRKLVQIEARLNAP